MTAAKKVVTKPKKVILNSEETVKQSEETTKKPKKVAEKPEVEMEEGKKETKVVKPRPHLDFCEKIIKGKICNSGTDFVDILRDDYTVVTVLRESIRKIKWIDPDCNPCTCDTCCDDCDCDTCCDDCDCDHDCCCDDHHLGRHHGGCCDVVCLHDFSIPRCDDRIQLRLAGLTGDLNFQFFRKRGCEVIIECSS